MTHPRVYKTEGVILKGMRLGEADKILTLYTPYLGKIRALAKGVSRPSSRMAGHLEPLTRSSLLLARGRNLDIITQSQTLESYIHLRSDLWRTSCALYMAELVEQFAAEHLENIALYGLLLESLRLLDSSGGEEALLRYFELHLLGCLGYRPQLQECLGCRGALTQGRAFFSASGGGTLCPRCAGREPVVRPISPSALKLLRLLQESPPSLLGRLTLSEPLLSELEGLMREYVLYLLEREPRSIAFLDLLRRQGLPRASTAAGAGGRI